MGVKFFVLVLIFSGSVGCAVIEKEKQKKDLLTTIRTNNAVWSYCYKRALAGQEDLEGEIQMSWQIDYLLGRERISQVKVDKSSVRSEDLVNCMKTAIGKLRFNLPAGVYKVSTPFVFKNDKERNILTK